jgi:hypothetical protein
MDPVERKRTVQARLDRAAFLVVKRAQASSSVRRALEKACAELREGNGMADTQRVRLIVKKYDLDLTDEEMEALKIEAQSDDSGDSGDS